MKYSSQQAEKLARQIRERFGLKIAKATEGTPVAPEFLAGLVAVESNGRENALRFEFHVFAKLKQVRDGSLLQYNKIRRSQIEGASDDALKNLATSFGATQTMGWWSIHLGITVADLRDPAQHLEHAVKLLLMNAGRYVREDNWPSALRIWNTGRPGGKTHDPDYVHNAGLVMDAYALLPPLPHAIEVYPDIPEVKPESVNPEPSVTTVPGKPPVIEVQPRSTSITTKIAAGASAVAPVLAATGLKIGGVEFKTGGLIAIAAVIIVGMIVGAWIWNESQKRRSEELRLSMANLANPEKLNVVAGDTQT